MTLRPRAVWPDPVNAALRAAWEAGTQSDAIQAELAAMGITTTACALENRARRMGARRPPPAPSGRGLVKTASGSRARGAVKATRQKWKWTPEADATFAAAWEANVPLHAVCDLMRGKHGFVMTGEQAILRATRMGVTRPNALSFETMARRSLERDWARAPHVEPVAPRRTFPVPAGGFSMMGGRCHE